MERVLDLPRPGLMPWFWLTSPIVTLFRWLLLIEPLKRLWGLLWIRTRERAFAEIEKLGYQNHFAAFYLSSFAIFRVRERSVRLELSRWQALRFARRHFEGETGQLTFQGKRLICWEPKSPVSNDLRRTRVRVFLSHSHAQKEDARWVAQVFEKHGLQVWLDENELQPADGLTEKIRRAIQESAVLVPFLSPESLISEWCLEEVELAVSAGVSVFPVRVSEGELSLPPRWRNVLADKLGDPVHLDLNGRNASRKLREFAEKIASEHSSDPARSTP